jgi:Pentapeptide repeats (8 copies)
MRPMAEVLISMLLVGYLIAAVAMAGEQERAIYSCGGPYANRTPTSEELTTVLSDHRAWLDSGCKPEGGRRAKLCQANLQGAILFNANFQGADLAEAYLFIATSSQTAMWARIRCTQSLGGLPVRNTSGSPLIRTHSVRFIGGYPGIKDRGKGPFSPDTGAVGASIYLEERLTPRWKGANRIGSECGFSELFAGGGAAGRVATPAADRRALAAGRAEIAPADRGEVTADLVKEADHQPPEAGDVVLLPYHHVVRARAMFGSSLSVGSRGSL